MFARRHNNIIYYAICLTVLVTATVYCSVKAENVKNIIDNNIVFKEKINKDDFQLLNNKIDPKYLVDKLEVKLYYETLCPDCRIFTNQQLVPVIKNLGPYLKLSTYPFGNAKMNKTEDGSIRFECQHGEKECYGNKLDACALARLRERKYQAVLFNACMMMPEFEEGSDDEAANKCGAAKSIDVEPIRKCAKGKKGTKLLAYYGEESKKAHFSYVPYVVVNGKEYEGENLLRDLCRLLRTPPPECKQ